MALAPAERQWLKTLGFAGEPDTHALLLDVPAGVEALDLHRADLLLAARQRLGRVQAADGTQTGQICAAAGSLLEDLAQHRREFGEHRHAVRLDLLDRG